MKFIKDNIILIMFAVLPFGFLSFGIIHEGQHLALLIAFVAILAAQVKNNWITAFYWYLCAWMLFICIMLMLYNVPPFVFSDAMNQIVFMTAGLLIFISVSNSKVKLEIYYNLICVSALIQAAIAIGQFLGFDIIVWILNHFTNAQPLLPEKFLVGTLGNNNFLAAYIAISMPFFFRLNWFYGLFLIIPCLFLCNTTAAFVPAIIGVMYYFYPKLNRKIMISAGLILTITAFVYAFFYHPSILDVTSETSRWVLWAEAVRQIISGPFSIICGFGPGAGWGKPFPMHNEWLQCLHMYGLIGLSLLLVYVLTVFRGNRMLFTAFIIAIINMFGNYSLHLAPSAFLIIIITGLIERERINGGLFNLHEN